MTFDESERIIRRNKRVALATVFVGWLTLLSLVVWLARAGR
jgi:hypothetical protein